MSLDDRLFEISDVLMRDIIEQFPDKSPIVNKKPLQTYLELHKFPHIKNNIQGIKKGFSHKYIDKFKNKFKRKTYKQ